MKYHNHLMEHYDKSGFYYIQFCLIKVCGSAEDGVFLSAKNLSTMETAPERSNRLARSEGSLQISEKLHQPAFVKNPRYARRFKGMNIIRLK